MTDQTKTNSDSYHKVYSFFQANSTFSFPTDAVIISGEPDPSDVYFIDQGIVKQTITTPKGQELCLNIYKPGSFFTLIHTIARVPNVYTFTSLTAVNGWKAPTEKVREFIKTNGDVSYELSIRLLRGLHGMLLKSEKLMQGDAQVLVAQTILTLAQRFPSQKQIIQIDLPLTHQLLADATGLSRETVTRELSKLRAQHVIAVERHMLTIIDEAALQQLCQAVTPITVI